MYMSIYTCNVCIYPWLCSSLLLCRPGDRKGMENEKNVGSCSHVMQDLARRNGVCEQVAIFCHSLFG